MGTNGKRPQRRSRKPREIKLVPVASQNVTQACRAEGDLTLRRERLLVADEVADWLTISPLTLRKWRCLRTHQLPFLKIGKTIRYRESDVMAFMESHMVVPLSVEAR